MSINFSDTLKLLVVNELCIHRGISYVRDMFHRIFALTYYDDLDEAVVCVDDWAGQERKARAEYDFARKIEGGDLWGKILSDQENVISAYNALTGNGKLESWFFGGLNGKENPGLISLPDGFREEAVFLTEAVPGYLNRIRLAEMGLNGRNGEYQDRKYHTLKLRDAIQDTQLSEEDRAGVYHLWLLINLREACKNLAYAEMADQIAKRNRMLRSGVKSRLAGIDASAGFAEKLKWIPFSLGGYAAVAQYIEDEFLPSLGWDKEFSWVLENIYFLRHRPIRSIEPDTSPYVLRSTLLNGLFVLGAEYIKEELKRLLLRFDGALNPLVYVLLGINQEERDAARKMIARAADIKGQQEAARRREEWLTDFENGITDPYCSRYTRVARQVDLSGFYPCLPIKIMTMNRFRHVRFTLKRLSGNGFKGDVFGLEGGEDTLIDVWTFLRAINKKCLKRSQIIKLEHSGEDEALEEAVQAAREEAMFFLRVDNRNRLIKRNPKLKKYIMALFDETYKRGKDEDER